MKINYERREQDMLVSWFKMQYPKEIIFSIPNDLIRHKTQAAILTRSGLTAGVPDVMIPIPNQNHGGLFIEMKRPKTANHPAGVLTDSQKGMLKYLNTKRYLAVCCLGFEEAKDVVKEYMKTAV